MPSTPLIVLDPGHGRYRSVDPHTGRPINTRYDRSGLVYDSGAVCDGVKEVELNDVMVARVALAMRARHYEVQLTRRINDAQLMLADLSTEERAYLAQLNAQAPDILPDRFNRRVETGGGVKALHLSIHANYADNASAHGTEFYIHTDHAQDGPSAQWAGMLKEAFRKHGTLNGAQENTRLRTGIIAPQPYRGDYDGHVVRGLGHDVGGVLAEIGYMTNRRDMARMRDPAEQKAAADLLAATTERFQQARTPRSPEASPIPPAVKEQASTINGALQGTQGGETIPSWDTHIPPYLPASTTPLPARTPR